ncbi:hypothetical protein [Aliidiomarina quisquiliarum]|uniref:hypothetical protein n=1 Tax=Aliidiomarina quisquiliarum TaxID=2938947 RepID=UPI00208DE13D|nr:hypothetical protein [Aliidiomarina quisquiliarum]MCO4322725.1 hypothetical protein [Aliidiomarina quisquiliarum]
MANTLKAFLLAVSLMLPGVAFATAQVPDTIRIDGEEHYLNTNPLSAHLESVRWEHPENIVISSANWRGYIASWEVKDEQLLLIEVTVLLGGADRGDYVKKSILAELFPSSPAGVPANWYSGALIVPQGEITNYVHMGYDSSYESYKVIRVDAGRVTEHLRLSSDEFEQYKDEKFEEFTETDEFKESLDRLRKEADGMTEEQIIGFMKSFFTERYLSL